MRQAGRHISVEQDLRQPDWRRRGDVKQAGDKEIRQIFEIILLNAPDTFDPVIRQELDGSKNRTALKACAFPAGS